MGCFLVMTEKDFQLADMMKQDMDLVSKVYNPITQQRDLLVKTDVETATFLQRFFPDVRKSENQQQHHILPQKHNDFFKEKAGINIHEWTVLLDSKTHGQMTSAKEGYTNAWNAFVDSHPGGSKENVYHDVVNFTSELYGVFGFSGSGVEKYKR
jgi:hypothetical protein